MTIHSPSYQKAGSIGRFIACTGCTWRSGFGTEQENRDQFDAHLRTMAAAEQAEGATPMDVNAR